MKTLVKLLEAAASAPGEGAAPLPETVLSAILEETGAAAARLGVGDTVLASRGGQVQDFRRYDLPVGRERFWVETSGGEELSEVLQLAVGVVLRSWTLRNQLKQARFAERRRLWEMESLRAIGEALGGSLEPTHIAEELLLNATALLDARRGEVWLMSAAASGLAAQHTAGGEGGSQWPCILAARVGAGVLTVTEAAALPDIGLVEDARIAVPVAGRRGRLGVLALAEREVRGGTAPFSPTDLETLTFFAAQAAVALESAVLHREAVERWRLERELELAAAVQRELLPAELPELVGFELAARTQSSRRVGGDVFDVIRTRNGLFLMLGDVAGKGVPAALMAAAVQSAVRVLLLRECPLGEVARQLHEHLLRTTPANKFATVFLAYLHDDGSLEYLSAGHNPVIVAGATGTTELLGASGPPLGLLPNATFASRRTVLPKGSLLLAYTDGLSEAVDAHDEEFGTRRLAELASAMCQRPVAEVVEQVIAAVDRHTGGAPLHDDRTVLAVKRRLS